MEKLDQLLGDWGGEPSTAASIAAVISRWAKEAGWSENQLLNELRQSAARVGLDSRSLAALESGLTPSGTAEESTQLTNAPEVDSVTRIAGASDDDAVTQINEAHDLADETVLTQRPDDEAETLLTQRPDDDDATVLTERPGDDDATVMTTPEMPTEMTASPDGAGGRTARQGPIGAGTVIKERFVLETMLGRGGMGAVYRAKDLRRVEAGDREVHVALKLLNDDFQKHPDAAVSLQREAKKAQTLAHPNIVTVYDFDRDGTTMFVSMAYLQGQPLDSLIRDNPTGLPMEQAMDITAQMARGLAYAHEKGFAHADFKPGNVFFSKDGNVRILDFGIARAAAKTGQIEVATEDTGEVTRFDPTTLGAITPAYASAEMLDGEPPESSDDVYALGCAAYELFTGRHPFLDTDGRKLPAVEAEKIGMKVAPLQGVPKRYQKAIARSLELRRPGRFASAEEFLAAIQPPSRVKRALLAAAVILAVISGGALYMNYEQSDLAVTAEGLSAELQASKTLISEGDAYLQAGEIEQAHKSYAQAWDAGRLENAVDAREQSRLKVVIDRRVNQVIQRFIEQSQSPELDQFGLEVMQLSLESLRDSDLGSLDAEINTALASVEKRLSSQQ